MRLLLVFARTYPRRTAVTMLCLLLAGLAEGLGVSSVLPLIRLASPDAATSALCGGTALCRAANFGRSTSRRASAEAGSRRAPRTSP